MNNIIDLIIRIMILSMLTGINQGMEETASVVNYGVEEASRMDMETVFFMAKCIEAEAGNQDLLGKRLVADVILNRADSKLFPETVEGVISQKGQFAVYPTVMERTVPSEETYEAIILELKNRTDEEILYFNCGGYNSSKPAYQHGDHYFGY